MEARNSEAAVELDTFQSSTSKVNDRIDELQSRINEVEEIENEILRASRKDRLFKVPSLFEKLLPSVEQECQSVESLAKTDPVKAAAEEIPRAMQKLGEGLEIARSIKNARESTFPKARRVSAKP